MVWSCIVAVLCGLFVQYRLPDAVSSPEMDGEALKTLLSKGLSAPIELVPGEPFFSEDYDSAKGAFLRAADRVGAEITELAVVGDLATDFAVLKVMCPKMKLFYTLTCVVFAVSHLPSLLPS
mgnify:FL=1